MFKCNYAAHEKQARKWILDNGLATVENLATMSTQDVENLIKKHCTCFKCDDD